ncbi:MAG: hypothetical protein ACI81O_001451 [Cyclobacteriaceae bacterium]|jgi:hypothetical protein
MSNDQVKRSGIFYVKEPAGVVVMWRGEVVERYASVEALVEGHLKGQQALEREMERVLQAQYRPNHD